jgi:hypothetical protein
MDVEMHNKSLTIAKYLIASLGILLFATEPAYAYIDPGTGSIILQAVVGALAAVALFWRLFLIKVKTFFGLAPKTNHSESTSSTADNKENT